VKEKRKKEGNLEYRRVEGACTHTHTKGKRRKLAIISEKKERRKKGEEKKP